MLILELIIVNQQELPQKIAEFGFQTLVDAWLKGDLAGLAMPGIASRSISIPKALSLI